MVLDAVANRGDAWDISEVLKLLVEHRVYEIDELRDAFVKYVEKVKSCCNYGKLLSMAKELLSIMSIKEKKTG